MRFFLIVVILIAVAGCTVGEAEQLVKNKPIKIAESGGVIVWKVYDSTPGGRNWVYYTSPDGKILGEI